MNRWKLAISLGGMLGALLLTSAATTQEDPDRQGSERQGLRQLGSMQSVVEEALRNSAEVHLAEAKVRQAELELTQVRMSVVRQVVGLVSDIEEVEQRLPISKRGLAQAHQLYENAMVSESEILEAEAEVINMTGRLQRMKLELDFLVGRVDLGGATEFRGLGGMPGSPPAMSGRTLPTALDLPLEGSFSDVPISMALEAILEGTGVRLVDETRMTTDEGYLISLTLSGTRLQWLTALADLHQVVFVLRDYGLLLTDKENARNYNALTIPVDFTSGG